MMTNFSFTSTQVLIGLIASALLFGVIILYFRVYFKKQGTANLTKKYATKKWRSPLTARNKYPEVDVFKMSPVFFRLGLIGALLITLLAFNWTQYEQAFEAETIILAVEEDVEIDVPRSAAPPPPPPPPPPPVIQEVPEEVVLEEDEIEFVDQSVDAETAIEIPDIVADTRDAPPPPPPPPPPPIQETEREIFVVVEEMPTFPGCEDVKDRQERKKCAEQKLMEYLGKNVRYPVLAVENGIEGTVIVQFVIEKDGSITNIKTVREIGGGCGDEAQRLVASMNAEHKWSPGKQRGQPVAVMFTLPVRFKLQYN